MPRLSVVFGARGIATSRVAAPTPAERMPAGSEVPAAQPREGKGCPGPPDADCQGEGGRCVAHYPVWAHALKNLAIQRRMFSAQRSVTLRKVSAYRTVSTSAVWVLASVPPIDLLAEER